MIFRFIVFFALAIATCANIAQAGVGGKVDGIWIHAGTPHFFFKLENDAPDHPDCATMQRYVVQTDTDAGRAVMAFVLSAKAQNKEIRVFGTGQCVLWGNSEDVNWVETIE